MASALSNLYIAESPDPTGPGPSVESHLLQRCLLTPCSFVRYDVIRFISAEYLVPTRLWPSASSTLLRLNLLTRHGFGIRRCFYYSFVYTASSFGVVSFLSIDPLDMIRLGPSALVSFISA